MQSKKYSLIESIVNTALGYVVTLIVSPVIYWICDVEINAGQMSLVVFLFTLVSIVRGYTIRRYFNRIKK